MWVSVECWGAVLRLSSYERANYLRQTITGGAHPLLCGKNMSQLMSGGSSEYTALDGRVVRIQKRGMPCSRPAGRRRPSLTRSRHRRRANAQVPADGPAGLLDLHACLWRLLRLSGGRHVDRQLDRRPIVALCRPLCPHAGSEERGPGVLSPRAACMLGRRPARSASFATGRLATCRCSKVSRPWWASSPCTCSARARCSRPTAQRGCRRGRRRP